mmetsp:Transcript_15226/g.19298  ORF Transcript_15226/g.19298 Transcript_15226/m.19298 type:complete len:117 (-) Transcript_15226:345-695(-)
MKIATLIVVFLMTIIALAAGNEMPNRRVSAAVHGQGFGPKHAHVNRKIQKKTLQRELKKDKGPKSTKAPKTKSTKAPKVKSTKAPKSDEITSESPSLRCSAILTTSIVALAMWYIQ